MCSDQHRIYFQSEADYCRFQMNPDFAYPEQYDNHLNHRSYILSLSDRMTPTAEYDLKYQISATLPSKGPLS